jgi:hypothetical protein
MRSLFRAGRVGTWIGALALAGCGASSGRPPGPGAFAAGVSSGLVHVHDGIAKALLGSAAGPMLIAPSPTPARATPPSAEASTFVEDGATLASNRVIGEPARPDDDAVRRAATADLDADGSVTLDEVVALGRSGLDDAEVVERLERTRQIFALSEAEEQYLRVRGISADVIVRLRTLNRAGPTVAGQGHADGGTSRAYDFDAEDALPPPTQAVGRVEGRRSR